MPVAGMVNYDAIDRAESRWSSLVSVTGVGRVANWDGLADQASQTASGSGARPS
jgi:hypothetical protein